MYRGSALFCVHRCGGECAASVSCAAKAGLRAKGLLLTSRVGFPSVYRLRNMRQRQYPQRYVVIWDPGLVYVTIPASPFVTCSCANISEMVCQKPGRAMTPCSPRPASAASLHLCNHPRLRQGN